MFEIVYLSKHIYLPIALVFPLVWLLDHFFQAASSVSTACLDVYTVCLDIYTICLAAQTIRLYCLDCLHELSRLFVYKLILVV